MAAPWFLIRRCSGHSLPRDPSVQSVSILAEGDMGDRSLMERGHTPRSTTAGGWLPSELCSDSKNHLAASRLSRAANHHQCGVTATAAPPEIILTAFPFLRTLNGPLPLFKAERCCSLTRGHNPSKSLFSRT